MTDCGRLFSHGRRLGLFSREKGEEKKLGQHLIISGAFLDYPRVVICKFDDYAFGDLHCKTGAQISFDTSKFINSEGSRSGFGVALSMKEIYQY